MRTVVRKLAVLLVWLAYTTGVYPAWSRLWRYWERRKGWPRVREVHSLPELQRILAGYARLWRGDPWWRLFDCVSVPEKLEAAVVREEIASTMRLPAWWRSGDFQEGLDCDEFAVWCCEAVRALPQVDPVAPQLLQVAWQKPTDPWWKVRGHYVCLFAYAGIACDRRPYVYHAGNWGVYGPFVTLDEALASIVVDGTLVCSWVCNNPADLRGWERVR